MSGRVLAMTSFKGGTGRTTTTANLAYRLAIEGRPVCVIDLDLASPTFGAVLQLEGMFSGARCGIHDLLPKGYGGESDIPVSRTREQCLPVEGHTSNRFVRNELASAQATYDILPGKADYTDALPQFDLMSRALDDILAELTERYDVVFVDVRSGTDGPLHALANGETEKTWVVFYRWTPQHLAGTHALIQRELVDEYQQESIVAVRTAYIPPHTYSTRPDAGWFQSAQGTLTSRQEQLGLDSYTRADIRREDILLWREGILTEQEFGTVCEGTVDDYMNVLEALDLL
jgi:MinD-like ATPase involved in chromosome partitioning or flagellar assembly